MVASLQQSEAIATINRTPDWSLAVADDPSYRHWATSDKGGISTLTANGATEERLAQFEGLGYRRCHEILIRARDSSVAENVASLIRVGTLLAYPDTTRAPAHEATSEVTDKLRPEFLRGDPFTHWFSLQQDALYGCRVAERAWGDQSLMYAIEKYRLSLRLDSFTPHSAAPRHGQVFATQYPELSYHVNAGFAVVAAFSVVEELGLEIRSSQKKPRWTDKEQGIWNPVVREEAESRLSERGVDLSETVWWLYRGDPSPLEQGIVPQLGAKTDYADGEVVRDREIEVVDALHKASYIRNFVVAHKFSELAQHLGPYDVHNVQLLARRLILSCLGLYKQFEGESSAT